MALSPNLRPRQAPALNAGWQRPAG